MLKRILYALVFLLGPTTLFATTTVITDLGFTFSPASVTITVGDTVNFQLSGSHNAVEVSQATYNANGNTPLGGGFVTPFGVGQVTGLSIGTHYYVCGNHFGSGMKGIIVVQALPVVIPNVWINEIHYENISNDTLEGYEIAGDAGTNLACYRVYLQSATTGTPVYDIDTLSGVIPNQSGCGYGTVWFAKPSGGLQNGPDAIVLEYAPTATQCGVNNQDTIIQFLSYEGSFTSTSGRTNGLTSTNISVSETSSAAVGSSLQLQGVGTSFSQFTWAGSGTNTYDTINHNQFFCGAPIASYRFQPISKTVTESAGAVVAGYVKANNVYLQTQTVTVFIKTGNGSDVNGFFQQLITFPVGVDSMPFNLIVTDDAAVEGTENLVFVLRNPSNNGTLETDSLFTLTIMDNDVAPNPVVSFNLISSSVNEGAGTLTVQAVILSPNANPTSVDINVTGGGTATAGGIDFSYGPITVTFPANSSAPQDITVGIADDAVAEGNEFFTFQLNNPTNSATIGSNNQHTVTILDNDTLRFDIYPPIALQAENLGVVNVPVRLTHTSPSNTSVTLQLVNANTTAANGTDFVFADTTIVFLAGASGTRQIPIVVNDDLIYEADETVYLRLVNPTNGAGFIHDTFQLTIIDDEVAPSGDCSNLFFSEYIEGTSNNKAIEVYNPTSVAIDLSEYRIYKSTNGGSSTSVFGLSGILAAGEAYVAANGQADTLIKQQADTLSGFFNFNGDDALALLHLNDTIDIIGEFGVQPIPGWLVDTGSTSQHTLIRNFYTYHGDSDWDNAVETWNTYHVDLFDSLGFHNTAPCGTVAPVPQATIRFVSVDTIVAEGAFTLEVVVETTNPSNATVSYFVARDDANSSATTGFDYIYTNQQIFGPPGISYDTSFLEVREDALIENTENVILKFLNVGPNITVGNDSIYTLNITDSDVLQVSFNGAALNHVEGEGTVPVRIVISTPVDSATSVSVHLAAGSATANIDYFFTDTTVVFPANTPDTQAVWITLVDDALVEGTEQINFDLINPTNGAVLLINAYTLYIIDDDFQSLQSSTDGSLKVKVYPNPVSSSLILDTENDLQSVAIKDLIGNTVLSLGNILVGKSEVDVSSLSVGMYIVTAQTGGSSFSKRIVKAE